MNSFKILICLCVIVISQVFAGHPHPRPRHDEDNEDANMDLLDFQRKLSAAMNSNDRRMYQRQETAAGQSSSSSSYVRNQIMRIPQKLIERAPMAENVLSMSKDSLKQVPLDTAMRALSEVCHSAIISDSFKPNYTPERNEFKMYVMTESENYSVPLHEANRLWDMPNYDTKKGLIMYINSWKSDRMDSNPSYSNRMNSDRMDSNPSYPNRMNSDRMDSNRKNSDRTDSNRMDSDSDSDRTDSNRMYSEHTNSDDSLNMLRKAINRRGTENFVFLDVGHLIENYHAYQTLNIEKIGQWVGDALAQMKDRMPMENLRVIGHGIGAHIAGVAGRRYTEMTGDLLPRITGLDPAMLCYKNYENVIELNKGDARFVDVIHSNSYGLGNPVPMGDADFYPNRRWYRVPGCDNVMCAHEMSVRYYAETVLPGNENNFMARKNNKHETAPMGYSTPSNTRGVYYMETNPQYPYGQQYDEQRRSSYSDAGSSYNDAGSSYNDARSSNSGTRSSYNDGKSSYNYESRN